MATLNTAFSIAAGALAAEQAALNIIANNTSNANTPGYTNEIPQWQANDPVTIGGRSYGMGVTMTGAQSQRDLILEQRIQQQTQLTAGSSARLAALDQLQSIFAAATSSTPNGAAGDIGQSIAQFFSALSQLQSNPADASLRQSVFNAAKSLVSAFHSASSELASEQGALDQQSNTIVTQVNTLTSSIAQLNKQISEISPDGDAGQLEDQRQYDLQQLSQLVGIHVSATEDNSITVTTSSGAVLISKNQSFDMSTAVSGGASHIFDAGGHDITADLAGGGGELGGTLQVRDQDIPQLQTTLDTLAYSLGSSLNTANEAGVDANGNPGAAIFNLPGGAPTSADTISLAMTDPSQIAAAGAGKGSSDDSNLVNMLALQNQAQSALEGDTPTAYYAAFVSSLGSLVSQVGTQNTAQQASLTQLQTQRDSLSAVNLNNQAAALENLQQAYQAAAKVFNILDSIMASALNLGLETPVS